MAPAPQNLLEAGDGAAASRPPHDMLNSPIDWDEMPDFGTEPARAAPPTSNSQVFSGNITQPRDSLQVLKGKVIFGRNFYSFNQAETPEWKRVTGARTRCKACDPIVPHFKNKRWVFYPSNSDVRIVVSCSWSSCERLRPKVKDGEFGLDRACKDLQEKAKCSETGAVP
ncbi:uncharacterized protein LY89DRAFT_687858 [Mollisia scopiformis]|uniref:Transcription factor PAP1 domain-containing protein n=1 Tax=Mollisia scopiformis TaxID=149040 RepID=A0A194WYC5_MOLSC|nr:uncharacterized protein LY89DRAFT_687858 [Mollisia scopiformis]KUJ12940.1 hypothetical protein LY89DRAFT_687858 [Mollisia scopiformis]